MKRDISVFFDCGKNTGMIFSNVDIDDLEYAINIFYSEPFYSLKDDNGDRVIINLSKVEFIRVRGTHEA